MREKCFVRDEKIGIRDKPMSGSACNLELPTQYIFEAGGS